MKNLKRFIATATLAVTVFSSASASAAAGRLLNGPELKIKSTPVPASVVLYAETVADDLLASVFANANLYGIELANAKNLTLGSAYSIFTVNDGTISKNDTFYFPILENKKVKFVLTVSGTENNYDASISYGIANELNSLASAGEEVVLYSDSNKVYAKGDKTERVIDEYNITGLKATSEITVDSTLIETYVESEAVATNIFKVEDKTLGAKADKLLNSGDENFISKSAGKAVLGASSTSVRLAMDNYVVNQQDSNGIERGMCWAASVASVVNYRDREKWLTAQFLCDYMGIDYDDGGTVYDIMDAYALCGYSYSLAANRLSWTNTKAAINNDKPFTMACFDTSGRYGHAVTLMGYTDSSTDTITIWNSGNQQFQTCTYGSSRTRFSYAGYTWQWYYSVY